MEELVGGLAAAVQGVGGDGAAWPRHGAEPGLPESLPLTLVELCESDLPAGQTPLLWRLLTSHQANSLQDAPRIASLYRQRWVIEEFFRTLKSAGF